MLAEKARAGMDVAGIAVPVARLKVEEKVMESFGT
jgi:hypothetical protein